MYKYELHLHTSETSRCGHVPAVDQVKTYHSLGYQGLCVTDHLHDTYLSMLGCPDNWEKCMDRYLSGYRNAKKAGEALGMDIILGCELRFPENESDYLLYGIDEQWLYDHPFICRMNHQSFFDTYGKEILIIHAHPYRHNDIVYYDCVHGLEVVNCNPRHDSRNELALKLAKENPHLYRVVGSDAHRIGDEGRAAILCENRITDSYEMKNVLTSGNFRLWSPGNENIIKECEVLESV